MFFYCEKAIQIQTMIFSIKANKALIGKHAYISRKDLTGSKAY